MGSSRFLARVEHFLVNNADQADYLVDKIGRQRLSFGLRVFFQFLENQETMVSIAVQNRIYDRLQPTRVSEMSSKKVRRKVGNFKLKLKRNHR